MMTPNDRALDELESELPNLMIEAGKEAHRAALRSGVPMVMSSVQPDGQNALIEVRADGTRKVLKIIEPRIPVEPGKKFQIR